MSTSFLAAVTFGASAAISVLLAGPVSAADIPAPPASQPPAPPPSQPTAAAEFSWTGCYGGGNGGGLRVRDDSTFAGPTYAGSPTTGTSLGGHNASSWLAGFQIGCSYQVGNWVFGSQGGFDWADAKGSHRDPFFAATDSSRTDQLMEMTWRPGYAWHQFLGYVIVGGGWERINYIMTMDSSGDANANTRETGGWIVGVGGEYAVTKYLSAFIEYEHFDFGTCNQTFLNNTTYIANVNIHDTKDAVKVGFNLRLW
jgi:outer membrane immunogenic protein